MKSPTQKKDIEAEDEDSMEPFSAQKSFHPNEQKFHSASIKDWENVFLANSRTQRTSGWPDGFEKYLPEDFKMLNRQHASMRTSINTSTKKYSENDINVEAVSLAGDETPYRPLVLS